MLEPIDRPLAARVEQPGDSSQLFGLTKVFGVYLLSFLDHDFEVNPYSFLIIMNLALARTVGFNKSQNEWLGLEWGVEVN
jgi:hypothetical protein